MAAHTDNEVIIEAPRDFVWQRMMDIESWPNLFSEYAKAEVIEEEGENKVKFRLTTHPDPEYDGKVWSWVSQRTMYPDEHRAHSERIDMENVPFQHMYIDWYFEPADEGTKMRWVQDFSMKPEAPADDETAERYMNKNTKEQMGVIKERLEEAAKNG